MAREQEILSIFSVNLKEMLVGLLLDFDLLQEIRLRINEPLILIYQNEEFFVTRNGKLQKNAENAYLVTAKEIRETMEFISNYSMYAYEEELKQGFLTIQGGHRIGIAGKVAVENGSIQSVSYISFINIRLSHQKKGCAMGVIPYVCSTEGVCHTMIISPPRCGKTTLLRDLIRQLSNGEGKRQGVTVGVVDERSEIGACYLGIPQNDLGMRTDILDCCPKAKGMLMLIRSMAPQVIAVDEIGSREDLEAIEYVINCGCKLIATVHGSCIEDMKQKPVLRKLVEERIFERFIVLNNLGQVGNISQIFDAQGNPLYQNRSMG